MLPLGDTEGHLLSWRLGTHPHPGVPHGCCRNLLVETVASGGSNGKFLGSIEKLVLCVFLFHAQDKYIAKGRGPIHHAF